MKRELYRTIALLSMLAVAAGPVRADEATNEIKVEPVKEDVKEDKAEESDDMDLKEFFFGRFATYATEENVKKAVPYAIGAALVVAAAWKFWPKTSATTGAGNTGATGTPAPSTPIRRAVASMPPSARTPSSVSPGRTREYIARSAKSPRSPTANQ